MGKKDLAMTSNMSTFVPDCTRKAAPGLRDKECPS